MGGSIWGGKGEVIGFYRCPNVDKLSNFSSFINDSKIFAVISVIQTAVMISTRRSTCSEVNSTLSKKLVFT